MAYTTAQSINIFLSYAHEDQAIADAIATTLRNAFFDTFDITMMSEFPLGVNWRNLIKDSIEKTDIMIAIATGRLKPGHSFMGDEIGSFTTSMLYKPKMGVAPNLDRRMIPFAVLDKTPDALDEYEGVAIDRDALHAVRFDAAEAAREIENLSSDRNNQATQSVVKFLGDIHDIIVEAVPGTDTKLSILQDRFDFYNSLALALCQQLFLNISNRARDVVIPKSRLIISVRPSIQSDQDVLATAQVKLQGSCYDSFGLSAEGGTYSWDAFLKFAQSEDIAYMWNEAFRSLLSSLTTSEFVENNTILSYDRKKTFRVFVAQRTTLFSGVREYSVYVIPLLKPQPNGDKSTTLLLSALQVSLGYRFMFLEGASAFSPDIIRATKLTDLQSTVSAMQNALNLLLWTAEDAGLNDPKAVVSILGVQDIEKVYELWDTEKKKLYDAASNILAKPVDASVKEAFIAQLSTFCDHTRELNERYTVNVMNALQERIGGTGLTIYLSIIWRALWRPWLGLSRA